METSATPSVVPVVKMGEFDILDTDIEFHGDSVTNYERKRAEKYIERIAASRRNVVIGSSSMHMPAIRDDRGAHYKRAFCEKLTFHNYLGREIHVARRDGLPAVIPSDERVHESGRNCFVIRKELLFDNYEQCKRSYDELCLMGQLNGAELKQIKGMLTQRPDIRHGRSIIIDYTIEPEELDNAQQCIYHHKSDTLVYFKTDAMLHRHPHCTEYVAPFDSEFAYFPKGKRDMGLTIRYVCNDVLAKPKFMRVSGKTLAIYPELDAPRKVVNLRAREKSAPGQQIECDEYIELFYPASADSGDEHTPGFRCCRLSVEDARMYHGVFDSISEAESASETYETRVRLLKERLEFEQLGRKRDLSDKEVIISKLEQDIAERDRRIEKLKADKAAVLEETKERRDTTIHEQKMSMEQFKFAAVVVTTLIGLIPILIKVTAKKS